MAENGSSMSIVRDIESLRRCVAAWRSALKTVALVPTMGALHAGHLALLKRAKAEADTVIVSVFVNPLQFGNGEDLHAYPKTEPEDWQLLSETGADLLYRPSASTMYPTGFQTDVQVRDVSQGLCDEQRPGHFNGVATVVTKLLLQSLPDFAVFGEKDYQQMTVVKRLVRDLDIPVTIIGVPTVRETDGLALSSRNAYLTKVERSIAPKLNMELVAAAADIASGDKIQDRCAAAVEGLLGVGFSSVDYVEVRNASTLAPKDVCGDQDRIFGAANLGQTRLIDNIPISFSRIETS